MPLEENQNLANVARKASVPAKIDGQPALTDSDNNLQHSQIHVMKARSRSQTRSPREVRSKTWRLDTLTEAPQLTLSDAQSPMNMAQLNGHFREQTSPERSRHNSIRLTSSPLMRSGLINPSIEQASSPEPPGWSSAVGHASTGKSGRVIERLQGDIDKLHLEKLLLKAKLDESEKSNETLSAQNRYLQDRNSNYEQSHEANQRHLARKDRLVEELRDELQKEKLKTAYAQETARVATASEESWRVQMNQAKSVASQKEIEYDAIVACRSRDNDRYQGKLDKMKRDFEVILQQWEEDLEKYRKLEIITEQQRHTIAQLDEHKKRLSSNFKEYRSEIDTSIAGMRQHVSSNDSAVGAKLEEMKNVTGEMRWVMNVDKEVNKAPRSPVRGKAKR